MHDSSPVEVSYKPSTFFSAEYVINHLLCRVGAGIVSWMTLSSDTTNLPLQTSHSKHTTFEGLSWFKVNTHAQLVGW
jgi:hypothetical protein